MGGASVKGRVSSWFAFGFAGRCKGASEAREATLRGKLTPVFVSFPDPAPAARQLSGHISKGRKLPYRTPAVVASLGLTCLALVGLAQAVRAETEQAKLVGVTEASNPHAADLLALREYAGKIEAEAPTVARIEESKSLHPHSNDPELLALREYAQQIGAEQPKVASIGESKSSHPHSHTPELLGLRDYAQQIGAAQLEPVSTEDTKSHNSHVVDESLVALREYAQQIGIAEAGSSGAPPIRLAADNAFDALRDFFGGNVQPDAGGNGAPSSTPNATPKTKSRAAPKRAKPVAPSYVAPVLVGNFVGSKTCLGCHAAQAAAFGNTLMGRIAKTQPGKFDCENCHGPGSEHLKAIGCAACHGEGGVTRRPGTPSLIGQDPQYLVPAMKAYVTGQRKHELMRSVLVGVGDAEFRSIASYYASQVAERASTPLVGNPAAGSGAIGVCAGCHGQHGISVVPAWPSLAGQDAQYLAEAMRAYKHGSRTKAIACAACHGAGGVSRRAGMPSLVGQDTQYLVRAMKAYIDGERKHGLMTALLRGVSDSELENMAAYYAGQVPARAQASLVGDAAAGKSAAVACVECHGAGRGAADPAWPSLAGQDAQYLAHAIRAYKEGSRDKVVACAACHGAGGISKRPGMPSLVGLDPQYLVSAMKGYVSGQRRGPVMKALLAGVSDAELTNMANYYARHTPARAQTPIIGDPSAGKTASATCAGCHGEQGVSSNPAWPSLAGQDARYLANALKAYKDGSRTDATMKGLVASLDERTINDIASYYAGLAPAQPSATGAGSAADPVLISNHVVASLDERAIDDVASYFASLQPEQPAGAQSAAGMRDPVLVRNSLLAGLGDATINNIASYYATQRPEQPTAARGVSGGPPPVRVGGAAPADGSSVGGIISFRKDDPSRRVEDNNAICLNCHERGERTFWRGSVHAERAVACTDCHTIMKNVSAVHQLKTPWEPNTCFQCHKDRQAQIFRSSHMPVREGKITCSNCHNPHGSPTEGLLREASINDNCYKCHAEKRGPFLFEHAPVRENCLNCHEAHGSPYAGGSRFAVHREPLLPELPHIDSRQQQSRGGGVPALRTAKAAR
jgi:DmsE family decaheme c-type cytochrome